MKNPSILAACLVAAAAALAGCNQSSPEGGRAGTDTFKVVVPATSTTVKQGEVQTVRVSIDRGSTFTQKVKLETKAPAGVSVDPSNSTVQPSDKGDVQLKITVAPDAALGEHKILVRGVPDKGEPTETEFKISVAAK